MQMTKEQAEKWAREMCEKGTGEARMQFYNKFGAGKIAENLWNDTIFTYGMEYGILIAMAFIFGDLPDENAAEHRVHPTKGSRPAKKALSKPKRLSTKKGLA